MATSAAKAALATDKNASAMMEAVGMNSRIVLGVEDFMAVKVCWLQLQL
jgi:hypothetical protein